MLTEWGHITWLLFHTLAEKINENQFASVKDIFIELIKDTCNNLLCPICTSHAVQTLKRANLKLIHTKADMIEFLRQFHNVVNLHLEKPTVEKEFVIKHYKAANLKNIITSFFKIYSHKYGNFEVNAFHRSNMRNIFLKRCKNRLEILGKSCYTS